MEMKTEIQQIKQFQSVLSKFMVS